MLLDLWPAARRTRRRRTDDEPARIVVPLGATNTIRVRPEQVRPARVTGRVAHRAWMPGRPVRLVTVPVAATGRHVAEVTVTGSVGGAAGGTVVATLTRTTVDVAEVDAAGRIARHDDDEVAAIMEALSWP